MSHSAGSQEVQPDSWFVIWTESRAEKKVETRIAALGLSPWLPTIRERRRWSDRWREVEVPLFPGYLFARSGRMAWHNVVRVPGVLTVVKERGRPALLADSFVSQLRQVLESASAPREPVENVEYHPGDEVVVRDGPLSGFRGVVRERRGARQLVVWLSEIGKGVAFTLGAESIAPAR